VQQAKQAAQPLRRSVAGQIEYWATLGRVVEHSGLTVQEAQTAIEGYEATAKKAHQADIVADLTSRLLAAESSGSLAQRVREVVEENRKLAK
jgi:ParD-like antitoxin of type II bacterial toxin-antitoxin system